MKTILAAAMFAAMLSAPALGQPQQLTTPAATAAAAPEAKPVAATKHRAWLKADARVCLEFPTDMQVIKCSEKYR